MRASKCDRLSSHRDQRPAAHPDRQRASEKSAGTRPWRARWKSRRGRGAAGPLGGFQQPFHGRHGAVRTGGSSRQRRIGTSHEPHELRRLSCRSGYRWQQPKGQSTICICHRPRPREQYAAIFHYEGRTRTRSAIQEDRSGWTPLPEEPSRCHNHPVAPARRLLRKGSAGPLRRTR